MTIKEYIESSNGQYDKLVKRYYCPVGEKYAIIKAMVDKSIVEQQNGVRYINTFVLRQNMALAKIAIYTDLKAEQNDNNPFENYDLVIEHNLINTIDKSIGESELCELNNVCKDVVDTFNNENSVRNYIISMVEKYVSLFAGIVGMQSDRLADILMDESKSRELLIKIDEVLKKK